MTKFNSLFLAVALSITVPLPAAANLDCVVIYYETDFSDNAGWETNNADNYYLDCSGDPECNNGAYFQRQVDASEEYAYHVLPGFKPNLRWRLEYDILPVDIPYCADSRIGLTDADMDASANPALPTYVAVNFAAAGIVYVNYCTAEGNTGGAGHPGYTEGIWYTATIEWDPTLGKLYYGAKERDSEIPLYEASYDVVGSFAGIDRVAMTTIGDDYCPGATGISYIDNIVVCVPEPLTVLLLGLGALGLRRKHTA